LHYLPRPTGLRTAGSAVEAVEYDDKHQDYEEYRENDR
jgi:hypothetical protein